MRVGATLMSSDARSPVDLILQVQPGVSEATVRELSAQVGGEFQYALGGAAYLIRVSPPQDPGAVINRLLSENKVVSVERDQRVHIPE